MEVAGAASSGDVDDDDDNGDDNDNGENEDDNDNGDKDNDDKTHLCRGVAGAAKNGGEARRAGRCRESPERKMINR